MSCCTNANFVMPRKMSSSYPNVFTYSYEGSSFTLDQGNDSNNIPPACVLSTGAICPEEKESPEKRKKSPTKDINQSVDALCFILIQTTHQSSNGNTAHYYTINRQKNWVKEIKFPHNYFFQKNFTGISGRAAMLAGGPCTLIPIIANSAPNLAN